MGSLSSSRRSVALSIAMVAIMLAAPLLSIVPASHAEEAVQPASTVTPDAARASVVKALSWLATRQLADGSWSSSCGVTGLMLLCYEAAGFDYTNATVQKGLGFIRKYYNATNGWMADSFLCYETSISLMAMLGAADPQDSAKLDKVANAVIGIQYTKEELNASVINYTGGWPNNAGIVDMSNSQFAILALQTSLLLNPVFQVPDGVFENATKFAMRCQNWAAVNPMPWAHNASKVSYNDGGFVYNFLRSRTPLGEQEFESYGSMTAAGLYVYLMAGHGYAFPETAATRAWLEREYSTTEAPRMGGKGMFYYLWTQARALAMSPQDQLVDGAGKAHDWRSDVASYVIARQGADGSWPGNPATGWREEEPNIASIYSILAMAAAYLMVPNPKLELEVTSASSARFVGLDGNALASDPAKGLTVTPLKLTCTDPETFRKVWVDIEGTTGATASVKATGTWGAGRKSESTVTVTLGNDGARVSVGTGGFAGPFGIFLTPMSDGPLLKASPGGKLELVRGTTTIIDLAIEETTGVANVTGLDVFAFLPSGASVDADAQLINVTSDGVGQVELTVFVPANATKGSVGRLVITSNNAMPIFIPVSYVDETSEIAPSSAYWSLILFLFVVVAVLIALPGMRRKSKQEGGPQP